MDPRKLKFLVTALIVVASMVALFAVSLNESGAAYYLTLSEFKDSGAARGDNFRLTGTVVPGTIEREPGGLDVRFIMADKSDATTTLPVHYRDEVPDTFVDNAEVVVEGQIGPDGVFSAHTLFAKCPSKYDAAEGDAPYAEGGAPHAGG